MMISNFRNIENSYIENFAISRDMGDHIIFRDDRLRDMYAFNCILVKENFNAGMIQSFVGLKLQDAKQNGQDFLKIIFHPEIGISRDMKEYFSGMGFEVQTNLYMELSDYNINNFKGNEECTVVKANSDKEFEDGQKLDVKTSTDLGMTEGFSLRKSLRKKEVYKQENSSLSHYLCYYKGIPIGRCELHYKGEYAKIEDFDVLENYRRRGFGTAILKKVVSDALYFGKKYIYLISDKEDTPRFMYEKLGFEIIGEEVELLWKR